MKRYEGLFILDTAGKEEALKDTIDKISGEITSLGGKVETVQKMERKNYARVANKKHTGGFYVNYIFQAEPATLAAVRTKFAMNDDVFRVLITLSPPKKATSATAPASMPAA